MSGAPASAAAAPAWASAMAQRAVRWPVALVVGFASVAALALLAKWVIENAAGVPWIIHWTETVPFITLVFAYFVNRAIVERLPPVQEA